MTSAVQPGRAERLAASWHNITAEFDRLGQPVPRHLRVAYLTALGGFPPEPEQGE